MSKRKIKTINVLSGVSSSFLEQTLTQDISPLEALFDLIDNSIDAARDHIITSKYAVDDYGLPSNYSGYSIHIRIDNDSIRISDNCLGIEESTLTQKTFRIAEPTKHAYGIGHYGLGLKRSLLKLGSSYAMSTDTGKTAFVMRFNNQNFGGETSQSLTADQYVSRGKKKALFSVSNLKSNVRHEMKEALWFKNATEQLSIRYAPYVAKGLKLEIRSIPHKQHCCIGGAIPLLRSNAKVSIKRENCEIDGVKIFIDAGIHSGHFFAEEKKHSLANNRAITSQYGLYFICNDRVIVAASSSSEHGFKTNKWHSEYNGFVCLVRFVSEDSTKMPWNTAKTALKTDSALFLRIREKIQPIADFYRGEIKKKYPSKKKAESKSTESQENGRIDEIEDEVQPSKSNNEPQSSTSMSSTSRSKANGKANLQDVGLKELMHPIIYKHAYSHYLNGHFRDAVLNAITAVFDLIREKTGLDMDGSNLITEAFALERARLILSELTTKSGRNDQLGFIQIFSGAYLGIRNTKAHSLTHDLDHIKTAQYLVFASLLARRVQEAVVNTKTEAANS